MKQVQADKELFENTIWPRSAWWMALLLISHCPSAWQAPFLAPNPVLNLAQERHLSNVVVVVVENGLSQRWSPFPLSPDIQASRPWPKHISQRDTGAMWLGQEVGWGRRGEWLLCSRLIRFHRTPPNYQSVGLYTQASVYVCLFLCGFCTGRVRTSVVCLGQRMQESICHSFCTHLLLLHSYWSPVEASVQETLFMAKAIPSTPHICNAFVLKYHSSPRGTKTHLKKCSKYKIENCSLRVWIVEFLEEIKVS